MNEKYEKRKPKPKNKGMAWAKPEIFPARLKQLMVERELIPADFYHDGVIGQEIVRRYLEGQHSPTAYSLARIATYLNVSVDYLLGLSDCRTLPPKWIEGKDSAVMCSHCHGAGLSTFKYCPNCGRQMQVDEPNPQKKNGWKK